MTKDEPVAARDIEIGPLTADLIPSFHQAFDVVARERHFLTFVEAPPLENTRQFVVEGQRKNDPRLVAVVAGTVVGWCDVSRLPFATKAHRGTLGLALIPGFRGRGLGRRLLLATLDAAWLSGFTRVELNVYVDNFPAIALYRKTGFVDEGIIRDAVCIDGRYRDAFAMAIVRRPDTPR